MMDNKPVDYFTVLKRVKDINYKWWKAGVDSEELTDEVVMDIAPYSLTEASEDNLLKKFSYLSGLKLYRDLKVAKHNHLLAINEEIVEAIVADITFKKLGSKNLFKESYLEKVDILIFLHLYLQAHYPEHLNKLFLNHIDIYENSKPFVYVDFFTFKLKWIQHDDIDYMLELYLYLINTLSLEDIITKQSFNSRRTDHCRE